MVKRYFLLVVAILMGSMTEVEAMMAPIIDTKPDVTIVRRSPCLEQANAQTIVLTKEDNILTIELRNYMCNCYTMDIPVKVMVGEGNNNVNYVIASVYPYFPQPSDVTDCECPCNVSFTVQDVKANNFYLYCWWHKGMVELTEGEQLVLKDQTHDVTIDETNFPDEIFRNFLLSQDYGQDSVLYVKEIKGLGYLNLSGKGIKSLKGIEHLTSLGFLNCKDNQLTTLDVSNLQLAELECSNNQLTELNLPIVSLMEFFYCRHNQLTGIDVSKFTDLEALSCTHNKIKGEKMDDLIATLPEHRGVFFVIENDKDEGNICTKAQVAAANAHGWTVLWKNGNWVESYDGNDPVVDNTKEKCWTMEYTSPYGLPTKYISTVLRGDTIINDIHFRKMWTKEWNEGEEEPQEWNASNSFLGQDDYKTYRYWHSNSIATEPYLILDFSLWSGDEIDIMETFDSPGALKHVVTAVRDTVLSNSTDWERRKCIHLHCSDQPAADDVWVEGIGSLKYGIEGNRALATGSEATLIKCTSDDEVLYLHPKMDTSLITAREWNHEYVPFVEEGKTWYCSYGCIFTMQGDTLIGGNTYKKVFCQYEEYYGDKNQHYYCAVREDSYQVFIIESEATEEKLLYDFNHPKGTITIEYGNRKFARAGGYRLKYYVTAPINQYEYNLFKYGEDGDINIYYGMGTWKEGIGSIFGNPFALEVYGDNHILGKTISVESCMKGNEYLYKDDWRVQPSGIKRVSQDHPSQASPIFDLQGRRLSATPQRGVYIRDGKKHVVK